MRRVIKKEEKIIGDTLVLVTEILMILNALMKTINDNYPNVIIKSDSLISIQVIKRRVNTIEKFVI